MQHETVFEIVLEFQNPPRIFRMAEKVEAKSSLVQKTVSESSLNLSLKKKNENQSAKSIDYNDLNFYDMPRKPDRWIRKKISISSPIPPMKEATKATILQDGHVYVFGGIGAGSVRYNHLYRFNIYERNWSVVNAVGTSPSCRSGHTSTAIDGGKEMCIYGGEGHFDADFCSANTRTPRVIFGDVWAYHCETNAWRVLSIFGSAPHKRTPAPRRGHSATLVKNNMLYIFGGAGPEPMKGRDHHFNDIWILDWGKKEWTMCETSGAPPPSRAHHTATHIRNKIYIIGGMSSHAIHQDIYSFDIHHNCWTRLNVTNSGPLPLYFHSAHQSPWYSNKIYIYGGKTDRDTRVNRRTWMFNTEENKWEIRLTKGKTPDERFSHLSWVDTDKKLMYIMSGATTSRGFSNTDLYTLHMHRPPMKLKRDETHEDQYETSLTPIDICATVSKWCSARY